MRKPKPARTIRVYKSYNFVDKDPIIDELRTAIADFGASYEGIYADSGVTVQTLKNWFHGKTRRPQFATVKAVARVIGCDLVLQQSPYLPKRVEKAGANRPLTYTEAKPQR